MSEYRISLVSLIMIFWTISCHAQYIEPQPAMGQKALKSFLKYHIDYPDEEIINNTQGTVGIEFTTDEDGQISDYHISKSVSQKLDSSAISIFKLILWKPATSYGKNVIGTSGFELKYNVKSFHNLSKRRGYKHIIIPFKPVDTSGIIYTVKQVDTVPKAILEPGARSLSEMIYSKLTYPDAAFRLGLVGEVQLSFIIETNGLPSNVIPLKHLGGGCTEEATKIVESIRWTPAIVNSKAVRTYYTISVHFKKDDKRDDHIPNQQGTGI